MYVHTLLTNKDMLCYTVETRAYVVQLGRRGFCSDATAALCWLFDVAFNFQVLYFVVCIPLWCNNCLYERGTDKLASRFTGLRGG